MDSLHVLFFTAMVFEFLKCSLNNFSNSLTCFQLLFHWFACKWKVVNWMTFVSFLCHVHCSWCYDQHLNLFGSVWLGGWKSGRIENGERMKKWEDRKNFSFPHFCLFGRVEKWRDRKLFCLIKNKVCINL